MIVRVFVFIVDVSSRLLPSLFFEGCPFVAMGLQPVQSAIKLVWLSC
jgi:hypothetical protein